MYFNCTIEPYNIRLVFMQVDIFIMNFVSFCLKYRPVLCSVMFISKKVFAGMVSRGWNIIPQHLRTQNVDISEFAICHVVQHGNVNGRRYTIELHCWIRYSRGILNGIRIAVA